MLPLVDRERLLGGNWNIRATAGTVFKPEWFTEYVDSEDELSILAWVRWWDLAATEPTKENPNPPWSRGAKVGMTTDGDLVVADMVGTQATAGRVEDLVRATAELDGHGIPVGLWQDPGQSGKAQIEHYKKRVLDGFVVEVEVASLDKVTYAKLWSGKAEKKKVILVRGPWNKGLVAEASGFPDAKLKDQIDAVSGAALYLERFAGSLGFLNAMTGRGGLRGAVGQGR
jgi:predicted phage terminase large subunit-like protein